MMRSRAPIISAAAGLAAHDRRPLSFPSVLVGSHPWRSLAHPLDQRLDLSPFLLEPGAVDSRRLPVRLLVCLLPGLDHQALQCRTVYMVASQ